MKISQVPQEWIRELPLRRPHPATYSPVGVGEEKQITMKTEAAYAAYAEACADAAEARAKAAKARGTGDEYQQNETTSDKNW